MSTVGYGDIYCTTMLGRTFIVLFILVGLVSLLLNFSKRLKDFSSKNSIKQNHKFEVLKLAKIQSEQEI